MRENQLAKCIQSFRLEILFFFILKEAVIIHIWLSDFDREGTRWYKTKDKAFQKIKATLSLVDSWRKAHIQSNFWLCSYQGFNINKIDFRIIWKFIQAGLMLTWHCTIRKQTHCGQIISWIWKLDQNKGLQYQEQEFGSIREWLILKLWSSSLSCCLSPTIWLAGLPSKLPLFQQAPSACLCRTSPAFWVAPDSAQSPLAHGFHSDVHSESPVGLAVHGAVVWRLRDLGFKYNSYTGKVTYVSLFHYHQCHRFDKP